MPHSIELGDLVQDGMIGLIDAVCRFDEGRGIKFETFAERRVRGAMIDALRRDAWPRGVRRQRRELEAAREELRRELGAEPSLADLAARVGSDEARLGRTIVRIKTIESTSPLSAGDNVDGSSLPPALVPSEPQSPDKAYEEQEVRDRIRAAIASLPPRERKVIGLYYYGEATMKQIGAEIGVNESRVSQLHARGSSAPAEGARGGMPRAGRDQPRRPLVSEHDAQVADGESRHAAAARRGAAVPNTSGAGEAGGAAAPRGGTESRGSCHRPLIWRSRRRRGRRRRSRDGIHTARSAARLLEFQIEPEDSLRVAVPPC